MYIIPNVLVQHCFLYSHFGHCFKLCNSKVICRTYCKNAVISHFNNLYLGVTVRRFLAVIHSPHVYGKYAGCFKVGTIFHDFNCSLLYCCALHAKLTQMFTISAMNRKA